MSALRQTVEPSRFPSTGLPSALADRCHSMSNRKPTDDAIREFYREVGLRIREAREAKGWRREDLALALGVGFKSVLNYETGKVTLGRITRLAEALDVDARWLLHGDTELPERVAALQDQVERIAALLAEPTPTEPNTGTGT
jgi:transcriptional regulator with XRE-family HTH domain